MDNAHGERLHSMYQREEKEKSIKQLQVVLNLNKDKEITLNDVMIGRKRNQAPVTKENIAIKILESLLTKNYTGRECFYKNLKEEDEEVDDIFDFITSSDTFEEDRKPESPLDIFNITFNCCNPSMKQRIVESLFTCKLSVPFVYYKTDGIPTVSSWSLRSLAPTWKGRNSITVQTPILDANVAVVSVMRIGRPSISKSTLLNYLANKNYHHTFYNKDSIRGGVGRLASCGTVECAWYLPSQKEDDLFSDLVMFLNIRGDLRYNIQVTNYICHISDIIFVVVNIEDISSYSIKDTMKKIVEENKDVYIILSKKIEETTRKKDLKNFVGAFGEEFCKTRLVFGMAKHGETKSLLDMKNEVAGKVNYQKEKKQRTFETVIADSKRFGMSSDEDIPDILEGKTAADSIFESYITPNDENNAKEVLLPLQSSWLKLSNLNRKRIQAVQSSEKNNLISKMKTIRKSDFDLVISKSTPTNFVHSIVNYLNECFESNPGKAHYYLYWLKQKFNQRNVCKVPDLRKQRMDKLEELTDKLKENTADQSSLKRLEAETIKAKMTYEKASFTFDHFIREVAQYYESIDDCEDVESDVRLFQKSLSSFGAKLLLNGYPLEIMDGDVSNIPAIWIRAVFNELHRMVGGKRLFIVSVVGLTSSGKSTLLNTMFGVKFAVSAGRCTKGVYMQLFPVETGFKFDYVLIIDTEGFRASEFEGQVLLRDNELATLSIGLGDITIINVKGETMNELKDILQISVHAFLKMKIVNKRLKLRQSCMFIHQNVPAADADLKLAEGRKLLEKNLNEVTLEAANQVGYKDIRGFSDVISYNPRTHIRYFSDLWISDPPMAASNPGYSDHAKSVKDWLLNDFSDSIKTFYTFEDVGIRTKDLWKGILSHDFIFSFRNTLEVKVFEQLEQEIFDWSQDLHKYFKRRKEITQTKLNECKTANQLQNSLDQVMQETEKLLSEKLKKLQSDIDSYIDNHPNKEIMMNYQNMIKLKLEEKKEHLQKIFTADVQYIKKLRQTDMDENDYRYREEIQRRVKKLVKNVETADEGSRKSEFEDMWKSIVEDVKIDQVERKIDVQSMVQYVLYNNHRQLSPSLMEEQSDSVLPPSQQLLEIGEKDILENDASVTGKVKTLWSKLTGDSPIDKNIRAETLARDILKNAEELANQIAQTEKPFNAKMAKKLYYEIYKSITNSNEKENFRLQKCFIAKLMVKICRYSIPLFKKMSLKYESQKGEALEKTVENAMYSLDDQLNAEIVKILTCPVVKNSNKAAIEFDLSNVLLSHISCGYYLDNKNVISDNKLIRAAFQVAKDMLNSTVRSLDDFTKGSDFPFSENMAEQVFKRVTDEIEQFNKNYSAQFAILEGLKAKLLVKVANYATTVFTDLQNRYEGKHSLKKKMERLKEHYYEVFIHNFQTTAESLHKGKVEFFKDLSGPIVKSTKQELTYELEQKLKGNVRPKFSWIKRVLTDLAKKELFQDYMKYIRTPKLFCKEWLKSYADSMGYQTEIEVIHKKCKMNLKACITTANEKANSLSDWLEIFRNAFSKRNLEIDVQSFKSGDFLEKVDVVTFGNAVLKDIDLSLDKEKEKCHFELDMNSINKVVDEMWGCDHQCYFCGESCQRSISGHFGVKHSCIKHRPSGLLGWCEIYSSIMVLDNCNELITGSQQFVCSAGCTNVDEIAHKGEKFHYYKSYRNCPNAQNWEIDPNPGLKSDDYWKYFIVKFKDDISMHYDIKIPDLPVDWYDITLDGAIKSLDRD